MGPMQISMGENAVNIFFLEKSKNAMLLFLMVEMILVSEGSMTLYCKFSMKTIFRNPFLSNYLALARLFMFIGYNFTL